MSQMKRFDAISKVLQKTPRDEPLVVCNGMISREVFTAEDRLDTFYMIGSMGLAASIGLGLSMAEPKRKITTFDCDGNVLMGLNAMISVATEKPDNFYHVIFDNGVHGSTGGQITAAPQLPIADVLASMGYRYAKTVDTEAQLNEELDSFFQRQGPVALHVKVQPGNIANIARVSHTPEEMTARMRKIMGVKQ